jgi:hypothetical protein
MAVRTIGPYRIIYFAAPLLTLVIVVGVAVFMRRCLPTPYAWLTGGRGGRSARRAADQAASAEAGEPAASVGAGEPI